MKRSIAYKSCSHEPWYVSGEAAAPFAFPRVESTSAWNVLPCVSTVCSAASYWGQKWQVWRAVPLMPCSSQWGAGSSTGELLCSALISWEQFSSLPAQAILLTPLLQFLLASTPVSLRTSAVPTSVTPQQVPTLPDTAAARGQAKPSCRDRAVVRPGCEAGARQGTRVHLAVLLLRPKAWWSQLSTPGEHQPICQPHTKHRGEIKGIVSADPLHPSCWSQATLQWWTANSERQQARKSTVG